MPVLLAVFLLVQACSRSSSPTIGGGDATARPSPIQSRDRAYYATAVAVDGNLGEWQALPYVPYGCDTLTEHAVSALVWLGWSEAGLFCAIETNAGQGVADWTGEGVDLFIDGRPTAARMDRYEAGVRHLTIKPGVAGGSGTFTDVVPRSVSLTNPSLAACRAAFASTADGWTCEVFVPWEALGVGPRCAGDWIAISPRITHTDGRTGTVVFAGAADVEPKNRLADTPVAFSPILLSSAPGPAGTFYYSAEEIAIAGEPWLQVEAIAPVGRLGRSEMSKTRIDVVVRELAINQRVAFRESVGGRYWMAAVRIPLSRSKPHADVVTGSLAVTKGWATVWKTDFTSACKVTRAFAEIEAKLPDASIDRLAPAERGIVHLMKACARESATLMAHSPDGIRAPQKRFRSVFEPEIYRARLELFLDFGVGVLSGRRIDGTFPLRTFQSSIDGEWLPIKVAMPWNYDPTRRYPACIYLYGKAQHRNRAEFTQGDLSAIAGAQYIGRSGDSISIVPYQRSDAAYELERETLDYIFERLLPSLPIDRARVGIYGGSAGAPHAVELATRHPDKFAWITARAGNYMRVLDECDGLYDPLRNLRCSAISLQTGNSDGDVTTASQQLLQHLSEIGVSVAFDELPATRHQFTPLEPPPEIARHALDCDPDEVVLAFNSPDCGEAFWLCGGQLETWGTGARIHGVWRDGRLTIETANVRQLKVRRHRDAWPRETVIDAQQLDLGAVGAATAELRFEKQGRSWIPIAAASPRLAKRKGLAGPAWRIEAGPLTIVYGTKSATMTPLLRERAFRILRTRLGPGDDQLGTGRFAVMSDVEALKAGLAEFNLWLIGSDQENLMVERVAKSLPVASAASAVVQYYGPNTLVSYIYPIAGSENRYWYVEIGNSRGAYFADAMPSGVGDLTVRTVQADGTVSVEEASFDTWWKLPNAR